MKIAQNASTPVLFQPGWFSSPHIQTIFPTLLRQLAPFPRRRERLSLSDGDFLDLDWGPTPFPGARSAWQSARIDESPLAVLLHGFTGSSNSHYILSLQQSLHQIGWQSVAVNWRGSSGTPNRLPGFYHAGATEDLELVASWLRSRYPKTHIAAVGFSLGACILANWLGSAPVTGLIDTAALVSMPLNLSASADRLDQGLSRMYRNHLLTAMKRLIDRKKSMFKTLRDDHGLGVLEALGDPAPYQNFRSFDDAIMAPLHGFEGAEDYYQRCSPKRRMQDIACPTLLVQARDDPFFPEGWEEDTRHLPACVESIITRNGGHLGFVSSKRQQGRPIWKPSYWLDDTLCHWLCAQSDRPLTGHARAEPAPT